MFRASDQSDNTLLIVWAATKARRPLSWLTTRVMIALLLLLLLLFLLLMDGSSCLASSALMLFRACAAALSACLAASEAVRMAWVKVFPFALLPLFLFVPRPMDCF